MSIPSVLLSNVKNESQNVEVITDVLEPNSLSQNRVVFVIPKKADVLDSKSALKIRVSWEDYVDATRRDLSGKWFSGLLGMIKNARLYAAGQLISDLRNAGEKIHLDKCFKSQEFREEYCDLKTGGNSRFQISEKTDLWNTASANSSVNGSIRNVDSGLRSLAEPYFRGIGLENDKNGFEFFVLLEELFPMMKDIQLPVRHLADEVRIEIDFEQDQDNYLFATGTNLVAGGQAQTFPVANRRITIQDCVLFLDFIKYDDSISGALEQQLNTQGVSVPFRQTAIITQALPPLGDNVVNNSNDVLLGQEGRSVMKIFCAKKYAKSQQGLRAGINQTWNFQGECRSEALLNEEVQCVINGLQMFDRNVVNNHEKYSYLSFAGESSFCAFPDAYEYNHNYNAVADATDVLYSRGSGAQATNRCNTLVGRPNLFVGDSAGTIATGGGVGFWKDGTMGSQNYIGIDCAKYSNGGDNPMNGLRIGATPIVFRLQRDSGADNRTKSAVSLTFFVEYLRLFDLRNGMVGVRDL
tara:strand:+ start:8192 stop:9763 length:1572 start_codon:yes stop_codon:yes gene_type:complete